MIDIRNYFAPSVLYPGLQITVQAGIVLVNGSGVLLPTQDIALPANSTSSIYLNTQTAAIQVAGSFPVTNCYPIAVAVTGTGVVNSLIDSRPDIGGVGGGGGGAWSGITNATADLTLANAGFNTTFNQTSATNWTWANTTAATNVTSQSSPILNVNGTYWNGSASALDSWTIQDVIANGTNGASALKFGHTGTSGFATVDVSSASQVVASATQGLTSRTGTVQYSFTGDTGTGFGYTGSQQFGFFSSGTCKLKYLAPFFELSSDGQIIWNAATNFSSGTWNMNLSVPSAGLLCVGQGTTAGDFTGALKLGAITEDNATAATSGVSQSSPVYTSSGRYWDGALSQTDSWTMQDVIANGTNGTSTLTFTHTGSAGVASVALPSRATIGGVSGFQSGTGNAGNLNGTFLLLTTNNFGNAGWYHGVNQRNNGLMAAPQGGIIAWASAGGNPGGTGLGVGIWDAYLTASNTLGRLNFGQSMITGDASATLAFKGIACGISVAALVTPSAPTVTVQSGAGASTWGYKVVVRDATGAAVASPEATVANNANLTSTATNKVVINRVDGAQSYDIYRTTVGTSPNTTGKIGTIQDWGNIKSSGTGNGQSQYFVVDTGVVTLSSVSVVGALTTYVGSIIQSTNNQVVGLFITVTGFANGVNNGTFQVVGSVANNFTVATVSQVNETHAGTATVAGDGTTVPAVNTSGGVVANRLGATGLQVFANNAAAVTGGLAVGDFYRTNGDPDLVAVVH